MTDDLSRALAELERLQAKRQKQAWARDREARQREAGALLSPGLTHQPRSWAEADAIARICDHLPDLHGPPNLLRRATQARATGLRTVAATACAMPPLRGGRAGWGPEALEWGAACRTMACLAVGQLLRGQLSAVAWLRAEPHLRHLAEAWRIAAIGARRRPLPEPVLALFG